MLTAQNRFKGLTHWPAAWEWKCTCTTHCALCVLAIAEIQDAWATQRLVPTKEGWKEKDKIVSLSGSFHIHFFELSRVSWVQFDGQRQVKWARYSCPCLQSQLLNFGFICADLRQLLLGRRQRPSEQHRFRKNKEYESLIEYEAELLASNVTNYIDWVKHGWLRTASYWLIILWTLAHGSTIPKSSGGEERDPASDIGHLMWGLTSFVCWWYISLSFAFFTFHVCLCVCTCACVMCTHVHM